MRHLATVCLIIACAPASAGPADQITSTGVLDFDLVHRGSAFLIRDAAYEITMPAEPSFKVTEMKSPSGSPVTAMTSAAKLGADTAVFSVTLMPADLQLDATGLDGMAGDLLRKTGAKLVADTAVTLGGLPARKVLGAGAYAGKPFQVLEYLAFDTKHHTVIGLTDISEHAAAPAFDVVRKSFTVKAGPAPHAK